MFWKICSRRFCYYGALPLKCVYKQYPHLLQSSLKWNIRVVWAHLWSKPYCTQTTSTLLTAQCTSSCTQSNLSQECAKITLFNTQPTSPSTYSRLTFFSIVYVTAEVYFIYFIEYNLYHSPRELLLLGRA